MGDRPPRCHPPEERTDRRLTSERIAAPRVLVPGGELVAAEVTIDDGLIVAVDRLGAGSDGPDRTLSPGFVDLQVNGIDDVDVAAAAGDDWERLDRFLLAQGVTTWCPTVVTAPLASYAEPLARIEAAAARPADGRPAIAGAHMEGPFIGGAPGAHRRQHIVAIDPDWLEHLPAIVRVITLAPELPGTVDAVRALVQRGVLVSLGHSTATLEQAGSAAAAGARLVTHLFNGMGPLHHREPGLVGAALSDDRLAVSLIADLVHVHPAALRTAFRAKGPGRVVLVTDAVAWRAGEVGRVRVAMVEGAPRLADGTLAGSALTMDRAIRNVVDSAGVPLAEALVAASTTPAVLLGLDDRGRIVPGARADLVALSPTLEVEQVWVAGTPVL